METQLRPWLSAIADFGRFLAVSLDKLLKIDPLWFNAT